MSEKRRSKKKPKAIKLHMSLRKKWEGIVKDVEKHEVPVNVLDIIQVALIDGTSIILDIKQMMAEGVDADEVEQILNEKFQELDEYIVSVDFHVDIKQVENAVQPETDKILKNL